jgi:hypothetical protein
MNILVLLGNIGCIPCGVFRGFREIRWDKESLHVNRLFAAKKGKTGVAFHSGGYYFISVFYSIRLVFSPHSCK